MLQQDESRPQSAFVQVDPLVGDTTSYACLQDPCAHAVSLLLRRGTWVHQSRPISCGARYLAEQQQRARKQRPAGSKGDDAAAVISAEEMGWQRVFIWVEGSTLYTGTSEGTPSSNSPPEPVGIMPPIFIRQQAEGAERIKDDVVAAGIANYLYAPKINVSQTTSSHVEDPDQKRRAYVASNMLMHKPNPFREDDTEEIWAAKAAARSYATQLALSTWTLAVGDSREIIFINDTDALAAAWVVGINGIMPGSESGIFKKRFGSLPSHTITLPSKAKGGAATNNSFGNLTATSGSSGGEYDEDEDGVPVGDMVRENDAYQPALSEGAFARIISLFNAVEVEEGFTNPTPEMAGGGANVSERQFEIEYIRMVANVVANNRLASTADLAMSILTNTPHAGRPFQLPLDDVIKTPDTPTSPGSKTSSHNLAASPYLINLILSLSQGKDDVANTTAILHEIVQQSSSRMKLTVHNLHDIRVHLQQTISLKFGYLDQYCEVDELDQTVDRQEVQRRKLVESVRTCLDGLNVQKSASGFNPELVEMSLFNEEGDTEANKGESLGGGTWNKKVMWLSKIGGAIGNIDEDMNMLTEEGAAHVFRLHYGKKKLSPVSSSGNSDVTSIEMSDVIDAYRLGAHEMQLLKAPERLWCLGWCIRLRTGRTMNITSETEEEVRAWCITINVLRPETKQEWEDKATMGRDMNRLMMLQLSIWKRSATVLDSAIERKCQDVALQRKIWRGTLTAMRREIIDTEEIERMELADDRREDFESISELAATSKNLILVRASKSGKKATTKEPAVNATPPSDSAQEEDPEVFLTPEEKYARDMKAYQDACDNEPLPPVIAAKADGNKCCTIQ